MDKAAIVGTFEFVGFHFCTTLLEQGIEVLGVHADNHEPFSFVEEKRFEIGRNANFVEISLGDGNVAAGNKEEDLLAVIDYYDYGMKTEIEELFHGDNLFFFLESLSPSSKVIFLAPIQLLTGEYLDRKKANFHKLVKSCLDKKLKVQEYYLPTIYGPWQSNHFLFHQRILNEYTSFKKVEYEIKEWKRDAIFIKDVVETILSLVESKQEKFILSSKSQNQWKKCAEYLSIIDIEPEPEINHLELIFEECEKKINTQTSFQKGLDMQREHIKTLLKDI